MLIKLVISILIYMTDAIPSVISARQYYKENLTVLGDVYTVGIFDIQLNESLYTYQAFGADKCFNNTSCRPGNLPCDPCDWTDPLICNATIRGPNSTCPCIINPSIRPLLCNASKFTFPYKYWPKYSNSTILEINNGAIIDVIVHPTPPNNCSCIIFKYDLLEGSISSVLLYYGEIWAGGDGVNELSRHGTCTICPSNPRWGQTQIIRIVSPKTISLYTKVKISIEYRNITSNLHSSNCNVPDDLISTHQCISTNVYKRISPLPGQSSIKLIINPPENQRCGVLGFWATSLEHLLSTNPWVSRVNSTGAFRSHRTGPGDGRLYPSVYPYCLDRGESLYAYILSTGPVDFFVDTAKEWLLLRPFTDYSPPDFYKRLFGAITVKCEDKIFTAHRDTYRALETMNTGSVNLRMVYPSDDVDSFYPPLIFANSLQYLIKNVSTRPMTPGRIIVSVLLNQRLTPRPQPIVWNQPWFPHSYEWINIDQWNKCVVNIKGKIATSDSTGIWITINEKNITGGLPTCNPNLYSASSRMIDKTQNEAKNLVSRSDAELISVYSLWFSQDRIAASNDFYSCRHEIESYYSILSVPSIIKTDQCLARFNSSEFKLDPCCDLNKTSLYDSCSVKDRLTTDQYEIERYTDSLMNCSHGASAECAKLSLTNLILQYNSHRDPTSCTNYVDRPSDQNVYWRCVLNLFGPEPVSFAGIRCRHDIDCIKYGSVCDVYSSRCFINITKMEIELVSCIYDGLTQFTRSFVSNELGVNPIDPNIKDAWLNKFYEILPCSDRYNPVGFDMNLAVHGRCHGCAGYIVGESNFPATWSISPGNSWANGGHDCWAPGSSTCSVTQTSLTANSYCISRACNIMPYENKTYFPYIHSHSLCKNASICGITDDQFFYKDITNIIPVSDCNNNSVCILANGTLLKTVNESACNEIFSCDVDCKGIECVNQVQCQTSGICSDATDYDIGIWTGYYKKWSAGCFFNIRYREPFNPTASVCDPPFRSTIIGCSAYLINKTQCESGKFQWGDPTIFELINPRWITKAKNEQECLSYATVCKDEDKPKIAALPSHTNVISFDNKCVNRTNLYQWKSGRWLPGQYRKTRTVNGSVSLRFSNIPRIGLNLPKILSNLTKAVDKLQGLKIQSSAFCRGAYKIPLDELVCSCITGYNESFCYEKRQNITSIGVLCDEQATFSVEDLKISTIKQSLPPATCDNLFIASSSIVGYRSRKLTVIRTLLVNYEEDDEFAIRNKQLGIYGKVLTNGYSFNFNTTIKNTTICIKRSILRENYKNQLNKYPIIDLAKRSVNSLPDDLIIFNTIVKIITDNGEYFCADLDNLENGQIYYFIQKVNQIYSSIRRTVFTRNETIYLIVLLTVYCAGLTAAIYRIIYIFYMHFTTDKDSRKFPYRLTFVLAIIGSFFLFRVVLFILLLNNSLLGSSSARAVNYVLFEFPIILYFAFVTSYICIWVTAIMYLDNITVDWQKKQQLAFFAYISVNFIIIILFIVMVILFETIIEPPYLACGGSILLFNSDRSYDLLLSYRIIFSSIAIIVGVTLFVVAVKVGNLLSNPDLNIPWNARAKIYLISVIGGFGLIGQAVYFLIITVTQSTPNNYSSLSILLVLEIIPALLFLFVENVERTGKKTSITMKKKSTNSSESSTTKKEKNLNDNGSSIQ